MKVEIWSDVVCPFCYIGKRRFEDGLRQFDHPEAVDVVWRSFELTPDFRPVPGQSIHESLAAKKGVSPAEGRRMSDHMAGVAKEVGLTYDFERTVPANTFLAHQLIHLGGHHGVQDATKERLFAAYYTEGRDLNDLDTLVRLGTEVGLDAAEIRQALVAGTYAEAVRYDEYQAQQIGVRGVPFFVFDDKYAVSGGPAGRAVHRSARQSVGRSPGGQAATRGRGRPRRWPRLRPRRLRLIVSPPAARNRAPPVLAGLGFAWGPWATAGGPSSGVHLGWAARAVGGRILA